MFAEPVDRSSTLRWLGQEPLCLPLVEELHLKDEYGCAQGPQAQCRGTRLVLMQYLKSFSEQEKYACRPR